MYKVSVLIPIYNVQKYIEHCARAVFSNTIISDCEIVFVNDCTPDDSMQIINYLINNEFPNLRDNIKIINNPKNLGISQTRNVLLNNATGEYVIFVDSDDWVESDYFEKMYNCAKANDADLVGCNLINEYPDGRKINREVVIHNTGYDCIKSWMEGNLPSWLWIKCLRRQVILDNKLFFEKELNYGEDALFMVQFFFYATKLCYLDEYLYHYYRRDDSISGTVRTLEKSKMIIDSENKIDSFLRDNYDENDSLFDFLRISKIEKKRWVIITGSFFSQKAFLEIWPEINQSIDESKMNSSYKKILKCENKVESIVLLFLLVVKKLLKRKLSLKNYFEKY